MIATWGSPNYSHYLACTFIEHVKLAMLLGDLQSISVRNWEWKGGIVVKALPVVHGESQVFHT